jgi:hypothetical protein
MLLTGAFFFLRAPFGKEAAQNHPEDRKFQECEASERGVERESSKGLDKWWLEAHTNDHENV